MYIGVKKWRIVGHTEYQLYYSLHGIQFRRKNWRFEIILSPTWEKGRTNNQPLIWGNELDEGQTIIHSLVFRFLSHSGEGGKQRCWLLYYSLSKRWKCVWLLWSSGLVAFLCQLYRLEEMVKGLHYFINHVDQGGTGPTGLQVGDWQFTIRRKRISLTYWTGSNLVCHS